MKSYPACKALKPLCIIEIANTFLGFGGESHHFLGDKIQELLCIFYAGLAIWIVFVVFFLSFLHNLVVPSEPLVHRDVSHKFS